MRSSRLLPAAAMLLLGAAALRAQSPDPSPSADIDQLWKYAGTWHIQTESVDSPYSKAGKQTSTLQNDCWRTAGYVACRQIVDGDSKILLVFTCGRPDHTCTSYQIPADGSPASNGTLRIEGNTWTFPWQMPGKDGKTTYFRVVNVWLNPETIEFRQEYSTDQAHWTATMTGHETKSSAK
ncbi:hypothetical protein DYQ86_07430 [Acidobacteria bacterium AB60]|nr:hypothetical protein DYQ86_07430 [Acidobacteria bacterium AB60]